MKRTAWLAVAVIIFGSRVCVAQPAADKYHAVYVMAGYFVRAGYVCPNGAKELIDIGFAFVSSSEMKAISQSFKVLSEEWMTEGASHFNDAVMKDGLSPACSAATADGKRARKAMGRPQ